MPRTNQNQSEYAKRQCKLAERVILATGVYDAEFRETVRQALDRYRRGTRSNLPALLREAKDRFDDLERIGEKIKARMREAALAECKQIKSETSDVAFQRSGQRRTSRGRQNERELTGLKVTKKNAAQVTQIKHALLLWSAFMLETSPGFMGRLYTAVADEWTQHVRGVLYEWAPGPEPREQTSCALNGAVLSALWKAQGNDEKGGRWALSAEEAQALRKACAPLLRNLVLSAEQGLAATDNPAETNPEVIDLQEKLAKLERLPENEGERFNLESEIYRLEHEPNDEWPDAIGGDNGTL